MEQNNHNNKKIVNTSFCKHHAGLWNQYEHWCELQLPLFPHHCDKCKMFEEVTFEQMSTSSDFRDSDYWITMDENGKLHYKRKEKKK